MARGQRDDQQIVPHGEKQKGRVENSQEQWAEKAQMEEEAEQLMENTRHANRRM